MFDFEVRSSVRDYTVKFPEKFEEALGAALRPGDVLLIDGCVAELNRHRIGTVLDDPRHLLLEASEDLKSYQGVIPIIEHLSNHGFRRDGRLVGVGGGIIQDVTGFTASIMFRGVGWIFMPTTLLAQCDSCIGSKTSINFGPFKNQLGNFYPPDEVHIDLSFLESLPKSELLSGLGEMAHYFLVSGEDDFQRFVKEVSSALADRPVLKGLVVRSLEIKKRFIEIDEFDRGERQVLNYGHSFGHALETVTEYRLPHGIAVSYGMDMANFVSWKMGLIPENLRTRVRATLKDIWRNHPIGDVSPSFFLEALRRDKKNVGKTLGLILTRGVGNMFKEQVEVTEDFEGWLEDYFESECAA